MRTRTRSWDTSCRRRRAGLREPDVETREFAVAEAEGAVAGEPRSFDPEQIPLVEGRYVGEAYGRPSPEGMAALRCLAGREGILLDPVYTAKAFAGLLDLAGRGELGRDEPLIFLHTGGLPALFAFEEKQLEPS